MKVNAKSWKARGALALAGLLAGMLGSSVALSQNFPGAAAYPSAPVRILIGVSAGGLSDILARGLAQELGKIWRIAVIVENRTGASDILATGAVAKANPDGHTILQTATSTWMTNQFLRKSLPYDPDKDFVPVIGLVKTSSAIVVGQKNSISNLKDLIELARAKPGALFYGSFGVASSQHLDTLALNMAAGIRTEHVPYKGGADVIRALLARDLDFAFVGITPVLPMIKNGTIKALAYAGDQRAPVLPNVPTLVESGYHFDVGSWLAWFAPAGTPREIVDKIAADAARVLMTPDFRDKNVIGAGLDELHLAPGPTAALLAQTRKSFAARVAALDLKTE